MAYLFINIQLRRKQKLKNIVKNIQNILVVKTKNTEKQKWKIEKYNKKDFNSHTFEKELGNKPNKNKKYYIKNSSRVINNTQNFIFKIIIFRKNIFHKFISFLSYKEQIKIN